MTDSLGDASDYVRQSGDFGINKYAFMDGCSRDIQEGNPPGAAGRTEAKTSAVSVADKSGGRFPAAAHSGPHGDRPGDGLVQAAAASAARGGLPRREPPAAPAWPPQRRADIAPGTVIELQAADIRQHLPPVSAARPAADKRDALRLDAAGVHHVHTIRQRIAHPFQHRPRQLCRPMLMRQAKKRRP